MKRILLLIAYSVFVSLSFGQTIDFQTNAPRCGDVIKRQQVEYFSSTKDGKDVLWDFSELNVLDRKEDIEYFLGKDSVLRSADSERMCFYNLSEDSLILTGYDSPLERMAYTQPIHLMAYPFSYGYTMSNDYDGTGSYCQRQVIKQKGTHFIEADAEGSIINANGDTLQNVIQIHSIRTGSLCYYSPSDSLFEDSSHIKQVIQDVYQWYAKGYRYPLYETTSTAYQF